MKYAVLFAMVATVVGESPTAQPRPTSCRSDADCKALFGYTCANGQCKCDMIKN